MTLTDKVPAVWCVRRRAGPAGGGSLCSGSVVPSPRLPSPCAHVRGQARAKGIRKFLRSDMHSRVACWRAQTAPKPDLAVSALRIGDSSLITRPHSDKMGVALGPAGKVNRRERCGSAECTSCVVVVVVRCHNNWPPVYGAQVGPLPCRPLAARVRPTPGAPPPTGPS
jgi:hypothetical protein